MAGSGLVRIMGGGPFIIYGRGCAGKNEGGYSFIIYGRGLAGKNEWGGGNHSLFMARGGLVRIKGGAFIIYGRGWTGKNEGGGAPN